MTVFQNFNDIKSFAGHLEMMKQHGECGELIGDVKADTDRVIVSSFFDAHVHLRDDELLQQVALSSARTSIGAIIMPNLKPAVESVESVLSYKARIMSAIGNEKFTPYMTLNFKADYTREELEAAKDEIIGIKMYPQGQTTNSDQGVDGADIDSYRSTLEIMSDLGIPLLVHGERIDGGYKIDECDKERKFAPIYEKLAQDFPHLKIIMEHVSTKEVIDLVDSYDNLYATVTLHHLLLIHNDIVSQGIKPHNYCMPIAKGWEDRKALLIKVLAGHPKVMFGSDSAPHETGDKEDACGCAGIFAAPITLQGLVEIFDSFGQFHNLQKFISENAQQIYGLELPEKHITLEKRGFIIPQGSDGGGRVLEFPSNITTFGEGHKFAWDITNINK